MYKLLFLVMLLFGALPLMAQVDFDVDQSVKVTVSVNTSLPGVTVRWIQDPRTDSCTLYRRMYGAPSWGDMLGVFPADVTQYVDSTLLPQQLYEYKLEKQASGVEGFGYVLTGTAIAPVHEGGRLLIVTTPSTATNLTEDIAAFREVLDTDGWPSQLISVAPEATAADVRNAIINAHTSFSATAVLLLGEVPIALSGDISPDAHSDHKGAWPADLYYGDLDGVWTDTSVNNATAASAVNHNVPGDGKWDQSFIPSDIELAVGRVDFSRLTVFTQGPEALIRRYLTKNIAFRTGDLTVPNRAAMLNTNPWIGALGQNGIRNFSPLVGPENITYGVWHDVFTTPYLWYYGAGSNLINNSLTGVFHRESFLAVFTLWFSSYVGDYALTDSYMAATLGSGNVLTAGWAGAPHWHLHSMAMGYPIAHGLVTTQNNDTLYTADSFPRGTHVNLLGDPSLKSVITSPPKNLVLALRPEGVLLDWVSAAVPPDQYYIYRRPSGAISYDLLDSVAISATTYLDTGASAGSSYDYLVRAARLTTTPSGSFWNLSAGTSSTIAFTTSTAMPATGISIKAFPNPVSQELTIITDGRIREIKLCSITGIALRSISINSPITRVDVSNLPAGYYLLRHSHPEEAAAPRVIIIVR